MRITADLRMYRHSGIGRYLRNVFPLLLPGLHADEVRVLGGRGLFGEAEWLSDPRVEIVETEAPIYSLAEQMLGLNGAYRGTDLLWVPHYNVPLSYGGRLVVTVHDLAPLAVPEVLNSALKRAYARLLFMRATGHAKAVLCVSRFTQKELKRLLHVPAEKITVTHLGVDETWPENAVECHQENDGTPYILFVGNVKPNKNLGLLLRVFQRVLSEVPFRLVVAGKIHGFGTMDEAVVRQAKALGTRVRFAGEVTERELMGLYAGAAALVMPSRYEGFGLPVLEAMRFGCPVLASNAGSLPEVGGAAALYFNPDSEEELAQCLLRVQDDGEMTEMRRRGHARARTFSFRQCAEQTTAVLNQILESV